jgi:hypothetical protein
MLVATVLKGACEAYLWLSILESIFRYSLELLEDTFAMAGIGFAAF